MPKWPDPDAASDPDAARPNAIAQVSRRLGIEPTVEALLDLSRRELGEGRATRLLELARLAPLTRRNWATAVIAQLILGTRELSLEWWATAHEEQVMARQWDSRGTPDALLEAGHASSGGREITGSCLDQLGCWIADDVSDKRWGRPVDYVDLNDSRRDDRIVLPDGARAWDRYVAAWDPGGRIWVDIIERDTPPDPEAERRGRRRGRLGSRLGDFWYDEIEALWEAWIGAIRNPLLLPGEISGEMSDPLAGAVDPVIGGRLAEWALANGATNAELGLPWKTRQDLWVARARLDPLKRASGKWLGFENAIVAAIDGDQGRLIEELARLAPS